jgi:hypothetical protein
MLIGIQHWSLLLLYIVSLCENFSQFNTSNNVEFILHNIMLLPTEFANFNYIFCVECLSTLSQFQPTPSGLVDVFPLPPAGSVFSRPDDLVNSKFIGREVSSLSVPTRLHTIICIIALTFALRLVLVHQ